MTQEEFRAALVKAASEAADKQAESIKNALRQAFYDGVQFEMDRQRAKREAE